MPSFARITLVGHAGRDPEQRYTPTGTQVVSFSVAVNQGRKQPDGSWSDETMWVRITAFGNLAERVNERVQKGGLVYVDGRLRLDHWTTREGEARTTLDVVANDVQALDKRERQEQPAAVGAGQDERTLDDLPF